MHLSPAFQQVILSLPFLSLTLPAPVLNLCCCCRSCVNCPLLFIVPTSHTGLPHLLFGDNSDVLFARFPTSTAPAERNLALYACFHAPVELQAQHTHKNLSSKARAGLGISLTPQTVSCDRSLQKHTGVSAFACIYLHPVCGKSSKQYHMCGMKGVCVNASGNAATLARSQATEAQCTFAPGLSKG